MLYRLGPAQGLLPRALWRSSDLACHLQQHQRTDGIHQSQLLGGVLHLLREHSSLGGDADGLPVLQQAGPSPSLENNGLYRDALKVELERLDHLEGYPHGWDPGYAAPAPRAPNSSLNTTWGSADAVPLSDSSDDDRLVVVGSPPPPYAPPSPTPVPLYRQTTPVDTLRRFGALNPDDGLS